MKLLANKQLESFEKAKICYICGEKLKTNMLTIQNIVKIEITAIIHVNIVVLQIACKI